MVQVYQPRVDNNNNAQLQSVVFSFPIDDTAGSIHHFEANIAEKILRGNVVDKTDGEKTARDKAPENERDFIPTLLSKERDIFKVYYLKYFIFIFVG